MDNIKMDFAEMGWGGVEWIGLTQDREEGRVCSETTERLHNWWALEQCSAP
jgi:hypothetical protein